MYKLHIKIGDFEFVEFESDKIVDLVELYRTTKTAFEPREGLAQKEWNALLDKYLNTAKMEQHEYDSCSDKQKWMIQELKKAFKRGKSLEE